MAQHLTGSASAAPCNPAPAPPPTPPAAPSTKFPPSCRQGGYLLGIFCYLCSCMSSQGTKWVSLNVVVKKHIHPFFFFFFLIFATFLTYFLLYLGLISSSFLREAKVTHLSLFSSLHKGFQAEALSPGWPEKDMLRGDRRREGQPSSRLREPAPRPSWSPQGLLGYKTWIDGCVPALCGRWSLSFSVCLLACLVFYHHILKCPCRP